MVQSMTYISSRTRAFCNDCSCNK